MQLLLYLCREIRNKEKSTKNRGTGMEQLIDIRRPVTVCRASAGTGKTYTLAAYYVGLLLSGVDYRSVLAITFTNKATAEMSERILGFLHDIAEGGADDFLAYAKRFMVRTKDINNDAVLRLRAGECFRQMLLDYDNVQIQTIDSFLQTLLGGLAGIVGAQTATATELDVRHVIRSAVDRLLSTDMTDADRLILEDYMQLALDQESRGDVHKSLCMLAEELYNESVQVLDAQGKILFNAPRIAERRKAVEEKWAEDTRVRELRTLLQQCDPTGYNRNVTAAYKRLMQSVEHPEKMSARDRFRGVGERDNKVAEMVQASAIAAELAHEYNTLFLTIRFSRDMELMSSLQAIIQRLLAEANSDLLAKTAGTLSKALHSGDADFILEKAGIRFRHVLIDEFQDTSRLQWNVIEQLLLDVLAGEGNTLLIVGDIKQSIYRWRNGDWHIMEGLTEDDNRLTYHGEKLNPRFTSLIRNFRSREEVVRFNLSLFDHIIRQRGEELTSRIYGENYEAERLGDFYQSDRKPGGYVCYRAFANTKDDELTMSMFVEIEQLLQKGANPSDIMILVRYKSEAATVTGNKSRLDEAQYPMLSQASIVSADSFLLEASGDVQLVIAALRYRYARDVVAKRYIELYGKPEFIRQIDEAVSEKTPLYEAVCELVRVLLTAPDGQYKGTETAYLNTLLDRTREYVGNYGSNPEQFLLYWDEVLHSKPIPMASSNAIQILTIHASKGLQAQTLFVPFVHWEKEDGRHKPKVWCEASVKSGDGETDFVPIQYGPEMEDSAYAGAYREEQTNLRIDNLNMLYVALTRAEDNLYVYTNYTVNKTNPNGSCNHIGAYLRDCYGDELIIGEPVVKDQSESVCGNAMQAEFWADSDQVRFVQSQEGALYTDYGDDAYRRMARMDEGTLCHELFAHIRKADELEAVLDEFETRGEIAGSTQRESLKILISSAWEGNEQMREWFTAPWELRLEEAIYIDRRELRPDRVMINPVTREAIVLDYKFGQWEDKYIQQVRDYMEALRRMGYSPVRGYLWFARKPQGKQLIEVHEE